MVTGRFANESLRQLYFRKRLLVSLQTFRSQFANVIDIYMSTCFLIMWFRILYYA